MSFLVAVEAVHLCIMWLIKSNHEWNNSWTLTWCLQWECMICNPCLCIAVWCTTLPFHIRAFAIMDDDLWRACISVTSQLYMLVERSPLILWKKSSMVKLCCKSASLAWLYLNLSLVPRLFWEAGYLPPIVARHSVCIHMHQLSNTPLPLHLILLHAMCHFYFDNKVLLLCKDARTVFRLPNKLNLSTQLAIKSIAFK